MAQFTSNQILHPEMALTKISNTRSGAHILYISKEKDRYMENIISYISAGLTSGELVVIVEEASNLQLIVEKLNKKGFTNNQLKRIIQLESQRFYEPNGSGQLDLSKTVQSITDLLKPFHEKESIVRFWGKLDDRLNNEEIIQEIIEFEQVIDYYTKKNINSFVVCVFNGEKISANVYMELMKHHSYMMSDTEFVESSFYNGDRNSISFIKEENDNTHITQLQLAQSYYARLIEEIHDAVFIISNKTILYVNKFANQLLEDDYLVGKRIEEVMYHLPLEDLRQQEEENPIPIELQLQTTKGKLVEVEVIVHPFVFEDLEAISILIVRDIRERKENQQLYIRNEKLGIAGQLAASIAHEIRNPLTAIKGFLKLVHEGAMNIHDIYPIIDIEINRIETIASELMFLGKPDKAEIRPHNIVKVLLDVYTLMQSQANLENVQLQLDCDEESLYSICNGDQIKQVLINLVKNAIEAMESGGSINIHSKAEEKYIVINIEDNGKGIPNEIKEKLGEPFYTTKEKGTGLGLVVCYNIITQHKGIIDFVSKEGEGTTFTIKLPRMSNIIKETVEN